MLSLGKKRAGKGKCDLAWADLVAYGEGLIAVLVPDEADEDCALRLRRLREAYGDRAYMALFSTKCGCLRPVFCFRIRRRHFLV